MSEIKISNKITAEDIENDIRFKKVRKLKKSLRDIEKIEERMKAGDTVEKTQIEKTKKKEEIINELEQLGETID
jgi:uncharacterized protein with WD repeat